MMVYEIRLRWLTALSVAVMGLVLSAGVLGFWGTHSASPAEWLVADEAVAAPASAEGRDPQQIAPGRDLLADVVPDGPLLYVGWAGLDPLRRLAPQARLRQLLEDPEVYSLLVSVRQAVIGSFSPQGPPKHPNADGLGGPLPSPNSNAVAPPKLAEALFSALAGSLDLPWALSLVDIAMVSAPAEAKGQLAGVSPIPVANVVFDDPTGQVPAMMANLAPTLAPAVPLQRETIAEQTLTRCDWRVPGTPPVSLWWGRVGRYSLMAFGPTTRPPARLLAGLAGRPYNNQVVGRLADDPAFANAQARVATPPGGPHPAVPVGAVYIDGQRLVAKAIAAAALIYLGEDSRPGGGGGVNPVKLLGQSATAAMTSRLGLADLQTAALRMEFVAGNTRHGLWIKSRGPRKGLLELFGPASLDTSDPLTVKALTGVVPAAANGWVAIDLDVRALYELTVGTLALIPGGPGNILENGFRNIRQAVGVDPVRQILGSLGRRTYALNVPRFSGDAYMSPVMVIEVRKPQTLRHAEQALVDYMSKTFKAPRRRAGFFDVEPSLQTRQIAGQTVRVVSLGGFIPVTPAWCVSDRHLIFSWHAQPVVGLVRAMAGMRGSPLAQPEPSAADSPGLQAALDQLPNVPSTLGTKLPVLAGLEWADTAQNYPMLSTVALMVAHLIANQGHHNEPRWAADADPLRPPGPPQGWDAADLPPPSSVLPHLRPFVGRWHVEPDALLYHSSGTLPLMLDSPILSGPLPGLAFFLAMALSL